MGKAQVEVIRGSLMFPTGQKTFDHLRTQVVKAVAENNNKKKVEVFPLKSLKFPKKSKL